MSVLAFLLSLNATVQALLGISLLALIYKSVKSVRAGIRRTVTIYGKVDVMSQALGPNGGKSLGDLIHSTHELAVINDVRTNWLTDEIRTPRFELTPDGDLERVNEEFTRVFGYTSQELRERKWIGIIYPEDREEHLTERAHAIENKYRFEGLARFVTKLGVVWRVNVRIDPGTNPAGEIMRWFGRVEMVQLEPGQVTS